MKLVIERWFVVLRKALNSFEVPGVNPSYATMAAADETVDFSIKLHMM